MQLVRRFRILALFCALAVFVCELISRPYAEMGIGDDWPYSLMAQHLAKSGHIVYNGWAAPMLGWQLYLAAAFIKLFGFSFTTVRMTTVLVSMALAFLLQRTLVRANITERNATIGALALVLSPLYLMLSIPFMTDIQGLFATAICLYGCLRALQASTSRATIGWLCFAVATNAFFGTSRQIAWLGILVMVPSTLWLLRAQRRVLITGAAVTLAGFLFIFACTQWLKHQPYVVAVHLIVKPFRVFHVFREILHSLADLPFLLLPIVALFLSEIRKSRARVLILLSAACVVYVLLGVFLRRHHPNPVLMPTYGDWVNVYGIFEGGSLKGKPSLFFNTTTQVLLTIASVGGFLGFIASWLRTRTSSPVPDLSTTPDSSAGVSWKQLLVLLAPYTAAYIFLLIPPAADTRLFDRYMLGLLVVALLCLIRYYQEQIQPRLPFAAILLVVLMAVFGVAMTHNTFALYRARTALAAELRANGVPDTSVDNGWEYNLGVELQHAAYINDSRIAVPAHAYVPTPSPPPSACKPFFYDKTPHIKPRYGISFDPNACYGPAPFHPVTYARWLASTPGTLYVVRYLPSTKQ